MSTNKTQNYNLHAWEPSDDFLRSEMNHNFAELDRLMGGKAKIVAGAYVGNSKNDRVIEVGAPILALLVEHYGGVRRYYGDSTNYGGIVLAGVNSILPCTITGTSFQVSSDVKLGYLNSTNVNYFYLALVEDA